MTDEEIAEGFERRVAAAKLIWEADPRTLGAGTIVRAMGILSTTANRVIGPWSIADFGFRVREHVFVCEKTREDLNARMRALVEELDRRLPGETST